ncbi:MAG: CNNM domain-containing protein [Planctomycetota bacterium]
MTWAIGQTLLALASFGAAAFFAGLETGYYRFSQIKLSQRVRAKQLPALWWQFMVRHREWFIAMVLVGTNLSQDTFSNFLYAGLAQTGGALHWPAALDPVWLSVLIGTPLILIGAEIAPKRLFNRRADTLMYRAWVALPALVAMVLLAPMVVGLLVVAFLLATGLRLSTAQRETSLSHGSLRYLIQAEASRLSAPMRAFALQLLDSHQRRIASVMAPWRDATVLAEDTPLAVSLEAFRRAGAVRLLVRAKDAPARVVGSLSLFDVAAEEDSRKPVGSVMRPACLIPAQAKVKDAVKILQGNRQSLAAVVDERQQAVGVVSLELLSAELVTSIKETGAGIAGA